jgi:hypothetical protein
MKATGPAPPARWCLAFALVTSGCAGTPTALGPREPAALYDPNDRIDYSVTECGAQVLIFLPLWTNDRVLRAQAQIEERAVGRYIANVRLRERWTYLVFGEILCTDVVAATFGPPKTGEPPPAR